MPKPAKVAKRRHHPALALADVSRWWKALGSRKGMAAEALRFKALTLARSGEVREATWDEFELGDRAIWTIPSARMKNQRQHRIPLTAEAVALLEGLPRREGCPFVFFGSGGGPMSDMTLSAVMRRMQEAEEKAGRPGYLDPQSKWPAVPHGLRATFRQWTAEMGYPWDMAEIALAPFIGSEVERAYQRPDLLERRREMTEHWASFLRGEPVEASNVVRLA